MYILLEGQFNIEGYDVPKVYERCTLDQWDRESEFTREFINFGDESFKLARLIIPRETQKLINHKQAKRMNYEISRMYN